MNTYKDLIVWQKAMDLVIEVYELTKDFPSEEKYGLINQMRRSAVSIPSNIAEGKLRFTNRECRRFFINSFSSGGELETQIELSKRLGLSSSSNYSKVDSLLEEVMKMLNSMISSLSSKA